MNFTSPSLWPWIDHPVSGLSSLTFALLRLAFAKASSLKDLTLLNLITRWPILQKVRHHTLVLCLLVGTRFQVLFHSPFGVLFTFPSRYLFAIGHMLVFSLRGWSPYLHSKLLVFTATCPHNIVLFAYKTVTFFGSSSQMILLKTISLTGLGCFPFARRYLENRVFFLFLLLLRCFSSQGLTS